MLVERYVYTPYGRHMAHSRGWMLTDLNDDGAVNAPNGTPIRCGEKNG